MSTENNQDLLVTDSLPKDLWVVVAALNEGKRIGATLEGLLSVSANIVVVDDGSIDNTATVVLNYPVWLLHHVINLGQGAALQTGIKFALKMGAKYVATFDADGQHEPMDLVKMYLALNSENCDFVLGSRFLGNADRIPLLRRLALKLAILFTWLFSGVLLTDAHNGIRVFTRRGAEQLRITLDKMEHASQIIDQILASKLKYIEFPVNINYTTDTLAKGQKNSAIVKLAINIFLEKLRK